jgi:hypothetical protein
MFISMNNMAAFASQLRQKGIDASTESKHHAVKGVQAGLVADGYFYSLSELNEPENEAHVMSLNFKAIRQSKACV